MGMTLAAKAALCICPTVVMGTAAISLPKARQAVHKATASRGKAVKSQPQRQNRAKSSQTAALDLPCPPAFAGLALPIAGAGLPIVDTSGLSVGPGPAGFGGGGFPGGGVSGPVFVSGGGGGSGSGGTGGGGGSGATPGDGTTIITPPDRTAPITSAVPEPMTWIMMVGGFAIAGSTLRWQRRRSSAARWTPKYRLSQRTKHGVLAVAVIPEAMGTMAMAGNGVTLAKLALCVCPPAMILGAVATVPAARQAVHAATAPAIKIANPYLNYKPAPLAPCLPVVQTAQSPAALAAPVLSMANLDLAALPI